MVSEDFGCIFRAFSEENWRQDPERGTIKAISKKTGLSTNILYRSLGNGRGRELRVDEFLSICIFLDKDPMYFCCESQKDDEKKEQDQ